jgi:hypothetical protein
MMANEQAKAAALAAQANKTTDVTTQGIEVLKSKLDESAGPLGQLQSTSASSSTFTISTNTSSSHQSSSSTAHSHSHHNHTILPHHPQQSHPGIHYKAYHPDPEVLYHDSGIDYDHVLMNRNASAAKCYEDALRYEPGTIISSAGALVTSSGKKTGRSPKDKRIVDEPSTCDDIWWGPVNTKLSEHAFLINHERAVDYLNTRERLYVFDGYAGWDPKYR